MLSIAELQPALHDLSHDTADRLAQQAGLCRRRRKLTGPALARVRGKATLSTFYTLLAHDYESRQQHDEPPQNHGKAA
jgi:hypothetical protein